MYSAAEPKRRVPARLIYLISLLLAVTGCRGHLAAGDMMATDPLSVMVHIYRGPLHHLSAVRRGTTPMYPATSVYALESLQKHGVLIGTIMTCDRLLRAGRDEMRRAPAIMFGGRVFSHDTVAANDFWWYGPAKVPESHLP